MLCSSFIAESSGGMPAAAARTLDGCAGVVAAKPKASGCCCCGCCPKNDVVAGTGVGVDVAEEEKENENAGAEDAGAGVPKRDGCDGCEGAGVPNRFGVDAPNNGVDEVFDREDDDAPKAGILVALKEKAGVCIF